MIKIIRFALLIFLYFGVIDSSFYRTNCNERIEFDYEYIIKLWAGYVKTPQSLYKSARF